MYDFPQIQRGKKEVILAAMEKPEWNPDLKPEDFEGYSGDMLEDLTRFSKVYMQKVTPRMVKVSIGLRTPELYPYTAKGILKIPQTFKKALKEYFCGDEGTRKDPAGRSGGTGNAVLVYEFWVRIFEGIFRL